MTREMFGGDAETPGLKTGCKTTTNSTTPGHDETFAI